MLSPTEALSKNRKISHEPQWEYGDIGRDTEDVSTIEKEKKKPFQQSDTLKSFYMKLVKQGLSKVYKDYKSHNPFVPPKHPVRYFQRMQIPPKHVRKVIIVGAGMAGLSAAYELKKAGHQVQILEMQERVGGRVKTFGEKEGFAKGLYVDGGAMRLPDPPEKAEKTHFLTDYYLKTEFGLDTLPFKNIDKNAFLKFYNMEPIRIEEWKDNAHENFCKIWPGWNSKIKGKHPKIKDIDEYYDKTVEKVKWQLTSRLQSTSSNSEKAKIWREWIDNYSQFPLNGFLRSEKDAIAGTLSKDYKKEIEESDLGDYIPWPEEAITAYSVYNYTQQLDQSLVEFLRDELGNWWAKDMHHIDGGMSKLPEKFYENLHKEITFNVTVNEIQYKATPTDMEVKVSGYYSTSGQPCEFSGNVVIVTTPLHIIRQIKIVSMDTDPAKQFPDIFYKAIEDVWYGPSTKIMIQTKTRFWEKSEKPIKGGFSKTNLPIGQLHYPTAPESGDVPEKGILLVYTWKSEALQFGALKPQIAIREAVRQIAEIHPEIENEYEVGAVQAWYNEPSAQGAYVLLKPHQYHNIERLMYYPFLNLFFAGEGISFTAGWIQGALESGLRAAYQFYARNEEDKIPIINPEHK